MRLHHAPRGKGGTGTDARVEAVCRAYFTALFCMARALPGAEVYDGPDILLMAGPTGHPAQSFAARCRSDAGCQKGLRFFRERGRPFTWTVTPGDAPAGLSALLAAAGLAPAAGLTGMHADRVAPALPPSGVAVHEAGPGAPPILRTDLERLHGQVFDLPAPVNASLLAAMWAQVDGPPAARRGRLYYAGARGAPAGLCYALPAGDTVGIYSVATAPAWRRRGIAGALVVRAVADARAAGADSAVLHAVPGVESVYARLGFVPVCRLETFTWPPPGKP